MASDFLLYRRDLHSEKEERFDVKTVDLIANTTRKAIIGAQTCLECSESLVCAQCQSIGDRAPYDQTLIPPWINGKVSSVHHIIKQAKNFFITKIIHFLRDTFKPLGSLIIYVTFKNTFKGFCPYEKVCVCLQDAQGKSYVISGYKIAEGCV